MGDSGGRSFVPQTQKGRSPNLSQVAVGHRLRELRVGGSGCSTNLRPEQSAEERLEGDLTAQRDESQEALTIVNGH